MAGIRWPRIVPLIVMLLAASAARAETGYEDDSLTVEGRDRLYQELAQRAVEFERRNILKQVVKLVGPSVVHIEASKGDRTFRTFGGRGPVIEEAGSGVVVELNDAYFVLTNRHVIHGAEPDDITINFADGRQARPTLVRSHRETDIAVLGVELPRLLPARVGDSGAVEIGDFVLAVGSPFGLSRSVTFGIISAKGRRHLDLGDGVTFQEFLQTDAAINPGNSGGPLLNLRGEVIGINTAIASNSGGNEGIGFSIPIDMVMFIARQLAERGSVAGAFLGVTLDDQFTVLKALALGLPRLTGARVTGVTPGSAAEAAKMESGDVILLFDGERVEDMTHLKNLVRLTEIGKEIPVVVIRDREITTLTVRLGGGERRGE